MNGPILVGVDGGGTRSTLVVADAQGRELARAAGEAGLVDPRDPERSARIIAGLARTALEQAGLREVPDAICAGLAGVGNEAERVAVHDALQASGVARRVRVASDGEIALEGAFAGGPGILLIAGTGSVAYGRAPDGRMERCGGWGMIVGDEGSGFALGRDGMKAALCSVDGREPRTVLLDAILTALDVDNPREVPPWAGRVPKSEIAALARVVLDAAEQGDAVARRVVESAAGELARHVTALAERLTPWSGEVPVVLHGGVLRSPLYASLVTRELSGDARAFRVQPPRMDAVHGALRYAAALVGEEVPV
ncbi:MAG TPA: BadF/BadG/BcrA/BcrD ATPase family protein [Longimicrobium sp.]|jgi:glucosamine kinase|uniref:BadF/BadG/BcrA/BcrD ATPase family protein n=1 Tax=Longimicrobium sp. TaxID=2029185 RepID=UPI002ED77F99